MKPLLAAASLVAADADMTDGPGALPGSETTGIAVRRRARLLLVVLPAVTASSACSTGLFLMLP